MTVRMADVREGAEVVESFADFGVLAFTTGRAAGTFGVNSTEPVCDVMGRWHALRQGLGGSTSRLATATQVHGDRVLAHTADWHGWLRGPEADGHLSLDGTTAMAVSVADCVPVFLAHPRGALAILHSGWRGTAANITGRALGLLRAAGVSLDEVRLHCGPAICGQCYEVNRDVFAQLTSRDVGGPTRVDLRALITDRARAEGVRHISVSPLCTRCDNHRLFSHRAGDTGRQIGLIARSS